MSSFDIADKTAAMIIRPGKPPSWLFVGLTNSRHDECLAVALQAEKRAKSKHTFGVNTELRMSFPDEFVSVSDCAGAIFARETRGHITRPAFWRLQYFFHRDGDEAMVFEFDWRQETFYTRSEKFLWNLTKTL